MEKCNTATFIGHSDCYGVQRDKLLTAIEQLILSGVDVFLCGGQGGFDRMCAGCVHELKSKYPYIRNCLVIPYLSFNIFNQDIFDEIIYPEGFEKYHFKAAIPARNKYLVENSAYALCFITHGWGGAAQTYDDAMRMKLKIINMGEL